MDWINVTAIPIIGAIMAAFFQQKTRLEIKELKDSINTIKDQHLIMINSNSNDIIGIELRVSALEARQ